MGYAAEGGGTIKFKADTPKAIIQMAVENFHEIMWEIYTEKDRPLEMDVCPAFRYDEDELYAALGGVLRMLIRQTFHLSVRTARCGR